MAWLLLLTDTTAVLKTVVTTLPLCGWQLEDQTMCGLGSIVEYAHLVSWPSLVRGVCTRVVLFCCIFALFAFFKLNLVCIFSSTVLFVSISQVIGCQDHLWNDLDFVRWGIKLCSTPNARHASKLYSVLLVYLCLLYSSPTYCIDNIYGMLLLNLLLFCFCKFMCSCLKKFVNSFVVFCSETRLLEIMENLCPDKNKKEVQSVLHFTKFTNCVYNCFLWWQLSDGFFIEKRQKLLDFDTWDICHVLRLSINLICSMKGMLSMQKNIQSKKHCTFPIWQYYVETTFD